MKMRKLFAYIMVAALLATGLTGCVGANTNGDGAGAEGGGANDSGAEITGKINVISREDGSGTRGAFIELFGVEEKDADGKKVDMTLDAAEITNSTSVMMTSVAGSKSSIGYISLGSLNDTVKALKIEGVAPSAAAIKDGSYAISRPFNIAVGANVSEAAKDFMAFIMSEEGQAIVEGKGYIAVENSGAYSATAAAGKVVVAGSSSVTPVMEALKEAYQAVNTSVEVEIQQSDSTTGMNSVIEGICDVGMASRELKESELAAGITPTVIALDGIAVIVNKDNPLENLSKEQVKGIYTGSITDWSEAR
ncbi:MAG: substrate-binding domain-containing protein [Candidatus Pelethousia sp.]|nr:substrate-binding domain-containing protein [Candidatus Pelethousia sp.]